MHIITYTSIYIDVARSPQIPIPVNFNKLKWESINDIERPLTDREIKEAAFSMGPFKAPGIDGLHVVFFQSQWDNIGGSVCRFVKDVFLNPAHIREVNQTLLVLIPKVDNPESIKDLRPISLCNVIYKLITKIIANRLKIYLPNLISPNQCSFVPGRHGSDNVIIAQEVIHTIRNMKGNKGFMALKIDL